MEKMVSAHRELRIVLVGKTGSGKSSTVNTIMGPKKFKIHFNEAFPPWLVTKTCDKREVEIDGRRISVIDTPGLFDTTISSLISCSDMKKCVNMSAPGPHAFLLVIRLDVRITDEDKDTLRWIQKNFGEEAARYTIILFTHADALKKRPLGMHIRQSNDFQAFVNKCGGRFHSFNNKNIQNRDQVTELIEKIEMMVEENGGQHYTNEMYEQAQRQNGWEAFQQKMIQLGKMALVMAAGAAGGAAAAGGAGAAIAGAGIAAARTGFRL